MTEKVLENVTVPMSTSVPVHIEINHVEILLQRYSVERSDRFVVTFT